MAVSLSLHRARNISLFSVMIIIYALLKMVHITNEQILCGNNIFQQIVLQIIQYSFHYPQLNHHLYNNSQYKEKEKTEESCIHRPILAVPWPASHCHSLVASDQ